MQGQTHQKLKEIIKELESKEGRIVLQEIRYSDFIIDLFIVNQQGQILKIYECIVTQKLSNARDKLKKISIDCEKIIARFKKPTNPKARKIISSILESGIKFVEI
jgi:hypothetical protein